MASMSHKAMVVAYLHFCDTELHYREKHPSRKESCIKKESNEVDARKTASF